MSKFDEKKIESLLVEIESLLVKTGEISKGIDEIMGEEGCYEYVNKLFNSLVMDMGKKMEEMIEDDTKKEMRIKRYHGNEWYVLQKEEYESFEHLGFKLNEFLYFSSIDEESEIKVYEKDNFYIVEYWEDDELQGRFYALDIEESRDICDYFKKLMFKECDRNVCECKNDNV